MPDKESMELVFSVDSDKLETTIKTVLNGAVNNINKDESLFKLTPHVDSSSLQNEISKIIKSINTDNLIILKTKVDSKKGNSSNITTISNENKVIENQTKIIKENNNVKQESVKVTDELNKKTKELLNNKTVESTNNSNIININDYVKAIGKLKSFEIELQSLGEYGKGLKVDFEDLRNTLSKSFTTDEFADWTKKFQAAKTLSSSIKKDVNINSSKPKANSDTLNIEKWTEQVYKIEELTSKLKSNNLKSLPIVNTLTNLQQDLLNVNTKTEFTEWINSFKSVEHELNLIKIAYDGLKTASKEVKLNPNLKQSYRELNEFFHAIKNTNDLETFNNKLSEFNKISIDDKFKKLQSNVSEFNKQLNDSRFTGVSELKEKTSGLLNDIENIKSNIKLLNETDLSQLSAKFKELSDENKKLNVKKNQPIGETISKTNLTKMDTLLEKMRKSVFNTKELENRLVKLKQNLNENTDFKSLSKINDYLKLIKSEFELIKTSNSIKSVNKTLDVVDVSTSITKFKTFERIISDTKIDISTLQDSIELLKITFLDFQNNGGNFKSYDDYKKFDRLLNQVISSYRTLTKIENAKNGGSYKEKVNSEMESLRTLWNKTQNSFKSTSSIYDKDYSKIQELFTSIQNGTETLPTSKIEEFFTLTNRLKQNLGDLNQYKKIGEVINKGFDTSSSITKISEINKALTNLIANTKTNSVDFSKAIENVKNAMNKYYGVFNGDELQMTETSAVKSLNVAFDKLKIAWNELQNATTEDDKINKTKSLTQAYAEYQTELTNVTNAERELSASLRNAQATQRAASNLEDYRAKLQTLQNTIQNFIQNNDRVLNNSSYAQQLNSLSDSIATSLNRANLDPIDKDTFNRFRTQFSTLRNEIIATGNTGKTFATKMAEQFSKLGIYFSAATLFMRARSELKKMYDNILALDTAMTELKKVTNETSSTYTKFLDDAINRATKLGSTLADTVNATADFARLGYNISDASTLADSTLIYKQVGDDIKDISEASSSIISTMKAFDVKAEDSISIVDKFNEVSNNFAISSGGIGEALQNSASSLAAANNTLGESIALIVAGNDVIQNPNEVGTALKTKRCLCVQQCA